MSRTGPIDDPIASKAALGATSAESADDAGHVLHGLGGQLLTAADTALPAGAATPAKLNSNQPAKSTEISQAPVELHAFAGPSYKFAGLGSFHQGVPDFLRHGRSIDGGSVEYDAAGNVVSWKAPNGSGTRSFQYKDVASQTASLPINPALPYLGPGDGGFIYQPRGASGDLSPVPESVFHTVRQIDQRLQSVTDESGKAWIRSDKSDLLQAFQVEPLNGTLVPTGEFKRDDELIPQTIPDAQERTLYANPSNPQESIGTGAIQQGNLGDCSFEAALASLAENNPAAILKMIQDNHDGTYTVKFPNTVNVRVEAPTQAELQSFNGPNGINFVGSIMAGSPEIVSQKPSGPEVGYWASVIEKARRHLSDRAAEDTGSNPIDSIRLLTGAAAMQTFVKATPGNAAYRNNRGIDPNASWFDWRDKSSLKADADIGTTIQNALSSGKLIVAGTPHEGQEWVRLNGGIRRTPVPDHLLPAHAYSVLKYEPAVGNKEAQIVLRNPWGALQSLNVKRGDGYFKVSVSDFAKLFNDVEIGG